ncbi:YkgJ family cysteine cluster protein [Actinoallomurus spadix]|uniref:YkgJ family cysteine cluster protein n=1 Tax=Actinoallomurus spadix TaxID=79912 RepID=A0ABN0W9U1_9ACTN|nr:YkgJ family cysteine cluster protein [Actinoallomurus spadix]MCO5989165.1 YkgJ family cysteine cluster protein [Actinoallomurus spadix]
MNGSGANVAGCAGCAGKCCRSYAVGVTIRDVRALVEGTAMRPSDFLRLRDADGEGFRLRPDGPAKEVYLQRRSATGACVFLMEIASGNARCGVYAHRPLVCSTFPLTLQRGVVTTREDTVCGPGSWNLATMDLPAYRRDLTRDRSARAEDRQVMRAWNKTIDLQGWNATPDDLYEYLLNCPLEVAAEGHED